MELLHEPVWRQFWYPVAFTEDLGDAPVARTLLGIRLVLWLGPEGQVVGAVDRCPHRDAPLSRGWTCDGRIVCPYHGWEYGAAGKVVHVPQTPRIRSFPGRFALETVTTADRYGAVWVCLDEPRRPLPDLPDGEAGGWRWIREFDEEWDVPAARLMENSFDPAHTVFVHRATFGDTARPDVDVPTIERTPYGMVIRSDLSVNNPELARTTTGERAADKTVRHSVTELHAPFLRVLRSQYPSGTVHHIVTAATPIDDRRLRLVQWAVRNDTEHDAPAAQVVAFDRRVTWEDQALLEAIWAPYSADVDANVHIKVDRPTVEIRRIYGEISAGTWSGLSATPAVSSSPATARAPQVPTPLGPARAPAALSARSSVEGGGPIPIVDLAAFTEGSPAERAGLVAEVADACERIGFLVVAGHGVDPSLIAETYGVTDEFFALPLADKLACTPEGWDRFCGFASVSAGANPGSGPPDLKEMFHANRFDGPEAAMAGGYSADIALRQAPNLWPGRPAGLEAAWKAYYRAMESLAATLRRVMALGLGLAENWFEPYFDRHLSNLSANWYPPQQTPPIPGQVRSSAHVDFSFLTILYQDDAPGGLEVRDRDQQWRPVPARATTFVVNLGDLTNRWTNDAWRATPHRVVNPPEEVTRGRISIPFFAMPDWEAVIECAPTCSSASRPPRYEPVVAGPHAEQRRSGRRAPMTV